MNKPELLSPAGDFERLKVAFAYGADAVYMAGKSLGMRAKARNFDLDEIDEGVKYAHNLGKKVYITANIIARNDDFLAIENYFKDLSKINPDALIISDPGIFDMAKNIMPNMDIHISTQANVTNFASVNFWKRQGANRIILARELSLEEISDINRNSPDIPLESFVHGAMCMAYSGRCLISNYMNHRDANRGNCSHPCRWSYTLVEDKSGRMLPVFEDEQGTHIFSSKDLCMIAHIPELINAGISSFKIEGRIKTIHYVGVVTKAYRQAIDDYFDNPELYIERIPYYQDALNKIMNREYTTGFYFGPITNEDHIYTEIPVAKAQNFVAIVDEYDPDTGYCIIEQRNSISIGDEVEVIKTVGENFTQVIDAMWDNDYNEITIAPHAQQKVRIKAKFPVSKFDMMRKVCT